MKRRDRTGTLPRTIGQSERGKVKVLLEPRHLHTA